MLFAIRKDSVTVKVAASFSESSIDLTAGKVGLFGARSGNPMTDSPLSAYEECETRSTKMFVKTFPPQEERHLSHLHQPEVYDGRRACDTNSTQ